ncbi:hypothetical protein [Pseudomonas sp. Marseille-QA0332]
MSKLTKLSLWLLLGLLAACEPQQSRDEKILAELPLQDAYEHNIDKMAELLSASHPDLAPADIEQVLRRNLTVEDQRQDLLELYSEANFSDAEFAIIVAATGDPARARALNQTDEGRQVSQKLTRLMEQRAQDRQAQARAKARMQQVETELDSLEAARQ